MIHFLLLKFKQQVKERQNSQNSIKKRTPTKGVRLKTYPLYPASKS